MSLTNSARRRSPVTHGGRGQKRGNRGSYRKRRRRNLDGLEFELALGSDPLPAVLKQVLVLRMERMGTDCFSCNRLKAGRIAISSCNVDCKCADGNDDQAPMPEAQTG